MTLWEHLEELRCRLLRILAALLVMAVVCFCFKSTLFSIVFAPKPANMPLVNIDVTQQLLTHMKLSLWMALLLISPFVLYELLAFVAPGLYKAELKHTLYAVGGGYILFATGVLLNYFIIFPITIQFLNDYSVGNEVTNTITLDSYVGLLIVMSLTMGIVFELPVLCWLLSKLGILQSSFMRRYRRHTIVAVLVVAAIITPTGDPFTLMLVAIPIYLLWELSILIVRGNERRRLEDAANE